jgi:tagatose 6-phosphate kinase
MIGVVCLNPALDITHHVAAVDWAGVNRPSAVHTRPGGKGLNVARTVHALGADVLVLGLAGGVTGAGVETALAGLSVPAHWTRIAGETRRTFTVVDRETGGAALFNEPGPRVSDGEFAEFSVRYKEVLEGCAAVVLSGSLPPGVPEDAYAGLISLASAAGVPVVLDTHGAALRHGAAAGPAIVKPNLAELAAITGRPLAGAGRPAVAAAARELRELGADAVVASLGADGLHVAAADSMWWAAPLDPVAGNPTGAGDAVVAALAHGLVLGRPWDVQLRYAVAAGAAVAMAPVAGEFSVADYTAALAAVTIWDEAG